MRGEKPFTKTMCLLQQTAPGRSIGSTLGKPAVPNSLLPHPSDPLQGLFELQLLIAVGLTFLPRYPASKKQDYQ